MKKLPIGVSTLDKIINGGYAYVDKTAMVHQLVENGSYYFLSRPRRFGKSLFIDTLKEAFEGNRDLFRRLWLHDHWDWEKKTSRNPDFLWRGRGAQPGGTGSPHRGYPVSKPEEPGNNQPGP